MSNPTSEDPKLQDDECGDAQTDAECGDVQTEWINDVKKRKMSNPNSEDPKLQDDECGDAQSEWINDVKKRKVEDYRDVCRLINISQLPKEEYELKANIVSARLSIRVEKKMELIDKTCSALEKHIDELKDLVKKKSNKTDQVIEAYKQKAINIKYAVAEESRKYEMDKARAKAEEDELKELENSLAMCHKQCDEIREKGKNERKRLTCEINKIKEKIASKEDRNNKNIQNLNAEKRREQQVMEKKHYEMQEKMDREERHLEHKIKNLRKDLNTKRMESQNKLREMKQQETDLLAKIEDVKKENIINENKLQDSITSLKDMLQINKDQNDKMKCIELMQIKFATTKEQHEKNMQLIQQIETKMLSQIEAGKAKMKQDIESLKNKLAEKHDKHIAAIEQITASLY